jgi:predicted nucleic acid-binding protein
MSAVFIDTSYFIALVNTSDAQHQSARDWAKRITENKMICHITLPIVFEIADGFSKIARREIGMDLLEKITNADNFIIHPFSEITFKKAFQLWLSRKDKGWGLTDCYSFELMKEQNLSQVLTADKHFEQYGYPILLK